MPPFLHGGMAFRAAEMPFLHGGNGFRAADFGFLHGGNGFRATDVGFLHGGRIFREAKWASSAEEWHFGRLKYAFAAEAAGLAGRDVCAPRRNRFLATERCMRCSGDGAQNPRCAHSVKEWHFGQLRCAGAGGFLRSCGSVFIISAQGTRPAKFTQPTARPR